VKQMSSYFDKASDQLRKFQEQGFIACSPEVTAFVEGFVRDILVRTSCIEGLILPEPYLNRVYEILHHSLMLEWPYHLYPDGPNIPECYADDEYYPLRNGIERMHDLFHEIAQAGFPGGDSVLFYRSLLEDKARDAFIQASLKKERLPTVEVDENHWPDGYLSVYIGGSFAGRATYCPEEEYYSFTLKDMPLKARSTEDLVKQIVTYLRAGTQPLQALDK